jgi:hypothetical protein
LERGRNDFWVGSMGREYEVKRLGRKPCMVLSVKRFEGLRDGECAPQWTWTFHC